MFVIKENRLWGPGEKDFKKLEEEVGSCVNIVT